MKDENSYWPECDVEGCDYESCSGGNAWKETGYWMVCSKHSRMYREGKPQPPMKQSAIDRENSRDEKGYLPISDKNAQVSDTTEDHSSNADGVQKILSDFGKRISGEAKSKTPLTEEAFKEELEKQYPLQGMKPNRFRQQGANWSFTNYTQPLLSELAEAKKEIERLKSQLDTAKKQWGIFK